MMMTNLVDVREEVQFIEALCQVYGRSRLTVERLFPPTGEPDQHLLDAIVWATEGDRQCRVAVEFTKCFQGVKVGRSSPTQNEVEAWRRFEAKIAATLVAGPEIVGRCVKCKITLVEEIDNIVGAFRTPRTRRDPWADVLMEGIVGGLAAPLRDALRESLRTKRAESAIIPMELQSVVAHAQVDAYADRPRFDDEWPPAPPGVYVEITGLVSIGPLGHKVDTILPRWVGIDPPGIIAAPSAKLEAIPRYKAIARECGAEELWLVVVADGSSQMSLVATPLLTGVKDGIHDLRDRAARRGRAFFDRVIFLAAGYWAPDDLRDLDAARNTGMTFAAFDLYG